VNGVLTGLLRCMAAKVIIADDDVRYYTQTLLTMESLLDTADLVRPQNYFDPLPWHAQWDTARTLINRAFGADFPGTLGLRRAALPNGYDGNVLFENLELMRTLRASGGTELNASNLFVRRRPPTTQHFLHQRVRQAYDSFAQPGRLAAELLLLPALISAARKPTTVLPLAAITAIAIAERGRRRAGGRHLLHARAVLWAPLWVAERAACSWIALACRLLGGVRYGERRIAVSAHSIRQLRNRGSKSSELGTKRVKRPRA